MKEINYKTYNMDSKDSLCISFLYKTLLGRIFLSLLIQPAISKLFGLLMDSSISKPLIPIFIKKNNINLDEYKNIKFKSFNDFFTREVKEGRRPITKDTLKVVAPCDSKLTVYPITSNSLFRIKNSVYNVNNLLQDKKLAKEFHGGTCLIFRLTTDDYHRYCYIDDGEIIKYKKIRGVLHTVRPIALKHYSIYTQNSREYVLLQTKNLGKIIQMEVGALCVGRIKNHMTKGNFKRGEEKGMFEFGGSTIVMLFPKNAIIIEDSIYKNTIQNKETIVKMGYTIGKKLCVERR